jgi:ABC-2 type transport system permease protein
MRNTLALAKRILQQLSHDPRTVGLFILAPIIALWLFSVLLGSPDYKPTIAVVGLDAGMVTALEDEGATVIEHPASQRDVAEEQLANQQVDALIALEGDTLSVRVDGADTAKSTAVARVAQAAVKTVVAAEREAFSAELQRRLDEASRHQDEVKGILESRGIQLDFDPVGTLDEMAPSISEVQVSYLHGSEDWKPFDFSGPVFIGIFVFVFVFITSGMSLVTERTGGTMERLLATPIRSWQLVAGYSLGFAAMSLVQAALVLGACITLIGFPNEGPLVLVVLVTFSMALVSLTLGLLVSALAKTAFQVVQLMILFVVPQILLSGIFPLDAAPGWMRLLSACFPISHGAEALRDIMLRGAGIGDIAVNLTILWGFILVFFALATLSFSRRRTS